MERCDVVVVGAGVVGLAVARALAQSGREVLVLERNAIIGSETSSRNSEVIHAGIYYPTNSLKAQLCVRGKALLYQYCEVRGLPYRRCGKLIVATEESQFDVLRGYQASAARNGVGQLPWLDRAAVRTLEPNVDALAGIWSESTGILDSHAYMLSLQGELEAAGGVVALNSTVDALRIDNGAVTLSCAGMQLRPRWLVNSAGLAAVSLARSLCATPKAQFARGRYYSYAGKAPFSHLVYPVAQSGGLGVHVTLDLAGQVRFGPDVEWISEVDYAFDDSAKTRFAAAIKAYYPSLEEDRLQPGYTGIRPKISGPGEAAADFCIQGPEQHGVAGYLQLLGIESPGLTASLAIAERVLAMTEALR